MEPAACERHGLRYDPRDERGCVLCRRQRARGRWVAGLGIAGAVALAFFVARSEPDIRAAPENEPIRAAAPGVAVPPRRADPVVGKPSSAEPAVVPLALPDLPRRPATETASAPGSGPAAPMTPPMNPADEIARDFRERDKGTFTVRFEGHRETALAYRALDILGEAYEEIRGRLRVVPAARIEVVIYTGGKFRAGVAGPEWSLARYDGKIRVGQADLMAERGALRDILYHEYAHALLSPGVGVPAWFHEGVAQYLEPSRPRPDPGLLARAGAEGELMSFAELALGFLTIEDARAARLAYMESVAIVEFMATDRGEDRLHGTIRQLVGGATFAVVMLENYGDRLERRWLESLSE